MMRLGVCVVTGAAGGIGAAVAERLRQEGRRVIGFDVIDALGVRRLDVTDAPAVEAALGAVEKHDGPIHALVNGAGVLTTGPATTMTPTDWARLFAVNTTAVFTVSTAVARHMMPRRRGAIVTIASNAGRLPRHSMAAYGASKAAAALFTQSLGLELAEYGIRCNVVSPGTTRTPMVERMLEDAALAESDLVAGTPSTFKAGIPLRRIAEPADIAETVTFLLSEQARHVTMHDLVVDGGASQGR